ncbi:MAG TPA: DnaD domain protein [Chroococcidiopsis sp.]
MASVSALLSYYSFDVAADEIDSIVKEWLDNYSPKWVIAAVVEAIFQGRYKIASVDTILLNWYLNGQPQHHFDNEFADLVCSKLFKAVPDDPVPVNPSGHSAANPPAKKQIEMSFVANSTSSSSAAPRSAPASAPGASQVSLPVAPPIAPPAYALNHVAVVSKTANKGIQRWFRFVTKL